MTHSASTTEPAAEHDALSDAEPESPSQVPAEGDPRESRQPDRSAQGLPGDLAPKVEAVLISRSRPMTTPAIARGLGLVDEEAHAGDHQAAATSIEAAIASLNEQYGESGRSFRIEKLAGGWRVVTLARFASTLEAFTSSESGSKLSRPAVETLAIIAYRQPVTRAQIESIRGVACGEVLRSLLERRLIAVVGRAEELGRPMLYGTTRQFLQAFGLGSIQDLPEREERTPS